MPPPGSFRHSPKPMSDRASPDTRVNAPRTDRTARALISHLINSHRRTLPSRAQSNRRPGYRSPPYFRSLGEVGGGASCGSIRFTRSTLATPDQASPDAPAHVPLKQSPRRLGSQSLSRQRPRPGRQAPAAPGMNASPRTSRSLFPILTDYEVFPLAMASMVHGFR